MIVCALLLGCGLAAPAAYGKRRAGGPRKNGAWVVGRVTQVTVGRVYVNMGLRYGLKPGDKLSVRLSDDSWTSWPLAQVTKSSSVVSLPDGSRLPRVGARARAKWRPVAKPDKRKQPPVVHLKPPAPTEQLALDWQQVDRRRPELVANRPTLLDSSPVRGRRVRGTIRLEYLGLVNLGSEEPRDLHRIGLWSDLDVPSLGVDWLDYSHRMRARLYLASDLDARPFQNSRPILSVYRLRLGLQLNRFRAQLGRMIGSPLPESTTVDGATVRATVLPWLSVGAFGGLLPRPDDLRPSTDASHFGAYTSLRFGASAGGRSDWSLFADAGFIGSTWDGGMDCQAVSARAVFDLNRLSVSAHAVIDFYGEDHPSGLSGVDPSLIGVSVDGSPVSWLRLGGRYSHYRFVPTRESLARFSETFVLTDAVDSLQGSADVRLGQRVVLSGQGGWDRQDTHSWVAWGELMLRLSGLLAYDDVLRLSGLTSHGTTLNGSGGRIGYLIPLAQWLSLDASYALHYDSYTEQDVAWLRHETALAGMLSLGRRWLLTSEARLLFSDEETLLQVLGTVGFRL